MLSWLLCKSYRESYATHFRVLELLCSCGFHSCTVPLATSLSCFPPSLAKIPIRHPGLINSDNRPADVLSFFAVNEVRTEISFLFSSQPRPVTNSFMLYCFPPLSITVSRYAIFDKSIIFAPPMPPESTALFPAISNDHGLNCFCHVSWLPPQSLKHLHRKSSSTLYHFQVFVKQSPTTYRH